MDDQRRAQYEAYAQYVRWVDMDQDEGVIERMAADMHWRVAGSRPTPNEYGPAKLTDYEASVMRARYNDDGWAQRTLAETGDLLHMTRNQARAIERRALKKVAAMRDAGNATREGG